MYSSGGDLHLDLPVSASDATQRIWEIPPYETKAIMKATFYGRTEGNHTGFVRIKTGRTSLKKEEIVLPFDVDVSSARGIFTNIDSFDFGTLRTMDEPKSLHLNMINTGNRSVPISSVTASPPNKAITIQFTPMVLKPSKKHQRVAVITYTALHVSKSKQQSGSIVVQTGAKVNGRKEIPYHANVLQGTLAYSVAKTAFYSGNARQNSVVKLLTITNTFNFSLIIYNATIPADFSHIFSIEDFSNPTVVSPGKLLSPLSIRYANNQSDLVLSTTLRLYTNASIFTIPLHTYTGKLMYVVDGPDEDVLDYGTVGVRENRTITFKIINKNPVEVSIKEYSCCGNIEFARLRLDFIRQGRKSKPTKRSKWTSDRLNSTKNHYSNDSDQILLRPKEEAVFSVHVIASAKEGSYTGEIVFKTLHEEVHVPMFIKIALGHIASKPKRIHFENSFPGQTKSHTVFLESSFSNALKISDIKLHPPDDRFIYVQPENNITQLMPNRKTKIGWVKLNPLHGSTSQCYLCLCHLPDAGCLEWLQSLSLPEDTWELDLKLLEKIKGKWEALKELKQTKLNTTLLIDTEVIKNYTIPIQASLTWPSLVEQSVRFPPTHIGNFTVQELTLTNSADVPVLVQILPLVMYPHPNGPMDLVSDRLEDDPFSIELNGHSAFSLPDIAANSHERSLLQSKFGVVPSSNTISILLKRRSKTNVKIGFTPDDDKLKTSLMVIRNNLTVLELVVIQGQGARGQLKINDKLPSMDSLLLFELQSSHLTDCNKSTARARIFPSFTVKRTFTASNVGQLPINIVSININGYECSGYGFRILDCEPFVLLPNKSRKLDITFTPDFTTSRLTRTLRLVTSMNSVLEFTLLATLPHHLLALCSSTLPRPVWEPYLHIVAALGMSVVFICVIVWAYIDAQKYVLQCTFGATNSGTVRVGRVSEIYTPGAVFDLNSINGMKVRSNDKRDSPDGKVTSKANGLHLPLQKRSSNEASPTSGPRSRSSSTTSSTSEISLKSTTSTPSYEVPKDFRLEPDRKDSDSEAKRRKSKEHGSNESIGHLDEKPKVETQRKSRKSEKEARHRRGNNEMFERKPYEEIPASNIVIQEVSILDEESSKATVGRQKKKLKSAPKKETKELKKQQQQQQKQQQQQQQTISKEVKPKLSLIDTSLVGQQNSSDSSFTKVESRAHKLLRKGNKVEPAPMVSNVTHSDSIDRLDEISISGPRPDGRDLIRTSRNEPSSKTKQDSGKRNDIPPRKKSQQNAPQLAQQQGSKIIYDSNGTLHSDTPTSPHAFAAAVVEKALEKSGGSKSRKNKGKLEKTMSAGSTPTSLDSLSESSRSGSYSSIVSNENPMFRFFGVSRGQSPTGNRQNTPSPLPHEDSRGSSGSASPVNLQPKIQQEPESWSAYIRRLAVGTHPAPSKESKQEAKVKPKLQDTSPQNSSSMFFYDNLSSLRATRKQIDDDMDQLRKAPGTKIWPMKERHSRSELNPSSEEFIPKSQRRIRMPYRERDATGWHENRKPDVITPPPGLSRSKMISDIWNFEGRQSHQRENGWNSFRDDTFKADLTNKIRNKPFTPDYYGVLLPQLNSDKPRHSELFDAPLSTYGHTSPTENIQTPWSTKPVLPEIDEESNSWATPGIRPSIWSNSRSYSADERQISRSLLGLDLSIPSYNESKEKPVDPSPMSPLSGFWDPNEESIDPYEGWSEDIKEG